MRGFTCAIRSASAANRSVRAKRRAAAAGISAVSRAIALAICGSVILACEFVDSGAQISCVALEQLRGFATSQSEPDQDGRLHVAAGLFEIAHCVGLRAANDFADNRFCATAQLGVAGTH